MLLEILVTDPDFEWLMIDASHIKVHPHAAGARGGNQDMGRTKGGVAPRYTWPWMRMVCRSDSLFYMSGPVRQRLGAGPGTQSSPASTGSGLPASFAPGTGAGASGGSVPPTYSPAAHSAGGRTLAIHFQTFLRHHLGFFRQY